jgi:hypothetical protein
MKRGNLLPPVQKKNVAAQGKRTQVCVCQKKKKHRARIQWQQEKLTHNKHPPHIEFSKTKPVHKANTDRKFPNDRQAPKSEGYQNLLDELAIMF